MNSLMQLSNKLKFFPKLHDFFIKAGQGAARGGKYYKREWQKDRWKYWYTKEEYQKDKKAEKEKSGKKFSLTDTISGVMKFFNIKDKVKAVQKIYSDRKEFDKIEKSETDKKLFGKFYLEYFSNKEKIDETFKKYLEKKKENEVNKQDEKEPEEDMSPDIVEGDEYKEEPAPGSGEESETKEPEEKKPKKETNPEIKTRNKIFKFLFHKYGEGAEKHSDMHPEVKPATKRQGEPLSKVDSKDTAKIFDFLKEKLKKKQEDNFDSMPDVESQKTSEETPIQAPEPMEAIGEDARSKAMEGNENAKKDIIEDELVEFAASKSLHAKKKDRIGQIRSWQKNGREVSYIVAMGRGQKFYTLQMIVGRKVEEVTDAKGTPNDLYHVQNLSKDKELAKELAEKFAEVDGIAFQGLQEIPDETAPHKKRVEGKGETKESEEMGINLMATENDGQKKRPGKEEKPEPKPLEYSKEDFNKEFLSLEVEKKDLPKWVSKHAISSSKYAVFYKLSDDVYIESNDYNRKETSPIENSKRPVNTDVYFKFDKEKLAKFKNNFKKYDPSYIGGRWSLTNLDKEGIEKLKDFSSGSKTQNNAKEKVVEKPASITPQVEKKLEEIKKVAPAFKLEAEELTQKEKQTKANDDQLSMFGKQPVEKYTSNNFKPKLNIEGNPKSISDYTTSVKNSLIKEGLDSKAIEFVNKAMKAKDMNEVKTIASEYVEGVELERPKKPIPLKAENSPSITVKLKDIKKKFEETKKKESEKKVEKEEERLEESSQKFKDSFKEIPANKIKTKEQYTSKDHFDRPIIEGIKSSILAKGYDPSFPISIDDKGFVVDGHHRFTAVQELVKEGKIPKNTPIPTITKKYDNEKERILDQVGANKMRRAVNPLDDAKAYQKIIDEGGSVSEIAERTGESQDKIRNIVALNNLIPELQELITAEHMAGRRGTGKNDDGTKEKLQTISQGAMVVIGRHGTNEDGTPNGTIQRKAFRYALDNKGSITPSQIASYINNLKSQSFSFKGVDQDGRSKSEQEAMKLVGDEDKAHAHASKAENFIKDSQKVFSKLFGESTGEIDPQLMKELTASVMGTKGEGKAQNLHDHLDVLIRTLSQAKDHVKRNMGEIKSNASMDDMFSFGKSKIYSAIALLEFRGKLLKKELK